MSTKTYDSTSPGSLRLWVKPERRPLLASMIPAKAEAQLMSDGWQLAEFREVEASKPSATRGMKISDFDVWHKPCARCGFDPGKGNANACWKCGHRLERDFSERALKIPAAPGQPLGKVIHTLRHDEPKWFGRMPTEEELAEELGHSVVEEPAPAAPGGEQKCPPCVNSGVCQTLGRCMYEEPSPPAGGGDAANGYCPKCGGDTLQRAGGNTDWCRCTPPPAAAPRTDALDEAAKLVFQAYSKPGMSFPSDAAHAFYLNGKVTAAHSLLQQAKKDRDELERESAGLREAIENAVNWANGREDEWGDRAVNAFAFLHNALNKSALAGGEEEKDV